MAPKGASRTPRLREVLSEVLRIRSRESVGCTPSSTQIAVERRALKNNVMALFTLKCVSGKLGLRNQSRGTQSRFLLKTLSSAINSRNLEKNTDWMTLGRFGA
ncbi:hypothetical protein MRB53_010217 [Persea americana]|uniref:Uncharacterized protein n=1 Tax=Persea americana TaxID=3435 RepID=A0ACC2LRE0_PERAE|nr:hypothetical protein MRB53_010217 [Persea americana]